MNDKKNSVTVIVSKLKEAAQKKPDFVQRLGEAAKPKPMAGDYSHGLAAAAEEILKAVEQSDAKKLSQALCDHYELAAMSDDEQDEYESEDGDEG